MSALRHVGDILLSAQDHGLQVQVLRQYGPQEVAKSYRAADDLFEKQWAMSLMQSVLQKLRADYTKRTKEDLFDALKQRIVDDGDEKYGEIASRLQLSEAVIKAEVHRLRSRYRELIRSEIAQTVASEEDVEAEIRTLFAALAK